MTTGADHYRAAEDLLRASRTIAADDLDPAQLLTATLMEAQVHATLALAAATAQRLMPADVWTFSGSPELYATCDAAQAAALAQYRSAHGLSPAASPVDAEWVKCEDDETALELDADGRGLTGFRVRRVEVRQAVAS